MDSSRTTDRRLRAALAAGLVLAAALTAGLGLLAGAVSLSGVEPAGGSYVDCGPAVWGRPDPLPHPACADAYAPLPAAAWTLLGLAAAALVAAVVVAAGHRRRPEASA